MSKISSGSLTVIDRSKERATQQHFWFNAEDIVDKDGVTVLTESGAYITDTLIDSFKQNKTGGYLLARSDGLVLGKDSNKDAILNSDGLIIKSGGIIAGESGSNRYIYLSTHDYPLKDTSDPDNPINGLTINNHTPTAEGTDDKTVDDPAWREVIGTKFGVDSEGNLYAAGAHIDGDIIAQSLTIGSGANAYDGMAAINISGYSIEIVIENIEDDDEHVYLYPHLYHNGIEERVSDYTRFLWYENNNEIAIVGDRTNYGRILASRSNSYRVTYEFDDGEVGSGTPIETIKVEPTEYITNIDNIGIKVHPKQWSTNSNYLQIDGNGVYIKDSNDISLAEFTASNAQIGKSGTTRFMINADSLQAFNELGNKYFEVNESGLTWGNNTAATMNQVNDAAMKATNYLAMDSSGIMIYDGSNGIETPSNPSADTRNVFIDADSVDIRKGLITLASFGTETIIRTTDGTELTRFGYDEGNAQNDTAISPYYTLGIRRTTTNVYSDTSTYKINDLCIYDDKIYVCNQPISVPEAWTRSHWQLAIGNYSVAEGFNTIASGYASHAEGGSTFAGLYAHAEGSHSLASGYCSHTEGEATEAPNICSHAEGDHTFAGPYAHAEGSYSSASGYYSHVQNLSTVAYGQAQTVIGKYNVPQGAFNGYEPTDHAFIIGNGTSDSERSNALAIDWRGRIHNNNSTGTSWIDGRDEAKIQFHPTISAASQMHPYISMKTNVGAWQISTYTANALYFAYTTDANYSSKTNSVTGAYITIAGAYTNMSDRKIKKNISSINNAKEFIMQLKPVQFNFKDIENDKLHMGFIAQEVAEAGSVINDDLAVYTANYKNSSIHKEELITAETDDEELSWSLCYSELIAPLVQTVQEQQKEIDQLKDMIKNGGNNGEKSS